MAKKQKESPSKKTVAPRKGEPVYTVMAFVTLVAVVLGCALLYMDFEDYGKQAGPTEKVPALPKLGEEQKSGGIGVSTPTAAPTAPGVPMGAPMGAPMAPAPGN